MTAPLAVIGLALVAVIVTEALVLRGLGWGSLGRCSLIATGANLLSACVALLLAQFTVSASGLIFVDLAVLWVATVLVEVPVLHTARGDKNKIEVALAAGMINAASYVLLGLAAVLLLFGGR